MIRWLKKLVNSYYEKRDSSEQIVNELRSKGVKVGKNVHVFSRDIDSKFGPMIEICDNVGISTHVSILVHDASTKRYLGYSRIRKVYIGDGTFVGTGCIILAGTHIGKNCLIGAGAVVRGNIPDDSIVVGNPGKVVGKTSEYIERNRQIFDETLIYNDFDVEDMKRAADELDGRTGFVL